MRGRDLRRRSPGGGSSADGSRQDAAGAHARVVLGRRGAAVGAHDRAAVGAELQSRGREGGGVARTRGERRGSRRGRLRGSAGLPLGFRRPPRTCADPRRRAKPGAAPALLPPFRGRPGRRRVRPASGRHRRRGSPRALFMPAAAARGAAGGRRAAWDSDDDSAAAVCASHQATAADPPVVRGRPLLAADARGCTGAAPCGSRSRRRFSEVGRGCRTSVDVPGGGVRLPARRSSAPDRPRATVVGRRDPRSRPRGRPP